jgi:hypothetical protein
VRPQCIESLRGGSAGTAMVGPDLHKVVMEREPRHLSSVCHFGNQRATAKGMLGLTSQLALRLTDCGSEARQLTEPDAFVPIVLPQQDKGRRQTYSTMRLDRLHGGPHDGESGKGTVNANQNQGSGEYLLNGSIGRQALLILLSDPAPATSALRLFRPFQLMVATPGHVGALTRHIQARQAAISLR